MSTALTSIVAIESEQQLAMALVKHKSKTIAMDKMKLTEQEYNEYCNAPGFESRIKNAVLADKVYPRLSQIFQNLADLAAEGGKGSLMAAKLLLEFTFKEDETRKALPMREHADKKIAALLLRAIKAAPEAVGLDEETVLKALSDG
jgi:hypothetical protein